MEGSGTRGDPYIITTKEELESIATNKTAHYKLGNDIDLGTEEEWKPFGNQFSLFTGTFDGDGHVIKNLYIHSTAYNTYSSLFGNGDRNLTEIRNLGLEDVDIEIASGNWYLTPLVINAKSVDNCYATGTVKVDVTGGTTDNRLYVSGLAIMTASVTNSWSSVDITFTGSSNVHPDVAGINAEADVSTYASEQVCDCYYSGTIIHKGESGYQSGRGVGGIVEANGDVPITVDKAVNIGAMSSTKMNAYVGRIAPNSSRGVSCTNCYAADTITGFSPVGTNTRNGANVNVSSYTTQTFWEETVGFDFINTWTWDSEHNVPKQRIFTHVPPLTIVTDSVVSFGDTAVFIAVPREPIVTTYDWDFGDGTTLTGGATVTHKYTTVGTYTVTVTDGENTADVDISVMSLTISGSVYFFNDVEHTITASAAPAGGAYLWSDGITTAEHTETYSGYEDGDHVVLDCSYTLNGYTITKQVILTCVDENIVIVPSYGAVVGQEVTLTAICSDPSITTFNWDFGDGNVLTAGATVTHTYETSQNVTINIQGGDHTGSYSMMVFGMQLSPNLQFANGIEHTITITPDTYADVIYWSDDQTGVSHTATYTGYYEGETVNITVFATSTISDLLYHRDVTLTCVKSTLTLITEPAYAPRIDETVTLIGTHLGAEVPVSEKLQYYDGADWVDIANSAIATYTFADTVATTHQFRYTATFTVQGVLSVTITVTTIARFARISTPHDDAHIFADSDVTFACEINDITNPVYTWSDGHTSASFTTRLDTTGTFAISVTVTGDEGTFMDAITYYVHAREDFSIDAPETFVNGSQTFFEVVTDNYFIPSVTWTYPDGIGSGVIDSHTFSGYHNGDEIVINASAEFTDELGNTYTLTHNHNIVCVYPKSYYENPEGERFYFDETCKILREGMSGFSEVPIHTDLFAGHAHNSVSGTSVQDRQITFNIYVKGNYSVMHDKRREMLHVMTPEEELGTLSYTRDDGKVFTIRCNIASSFPRFEDEAVKAGWVGTISFISPNGAWEGSEVTMDASDVTNTGDLPCGFRALLTGNLKNETNGEVIEAFEGTLEGYLVDTSEAIVLKEIAGEWVSAWEDVSINSTAVVLKRGHNVISGCDTITFRPRYTGV